MRSVLLLLACLSAAIEATPKAKRSGISTDPTTFAGNSYDYVIVGGGTAGSVLANRLTESGEYTVAVIEAGGTGYESGTSFENRLLSPALAYLNGLTGTQYDWQFKTTSQSNLNNRQINWPRGKILGGSSAINGLYLVQPSVPEYEAWAELIGDNNWGWATSDASRKKSQDYEAPSSTAAKEIHAVQNLSAWGENGPIDFGFPPPLYAAQEDAWIPTFAALGIGTQDPGSGYSIGAIDSTSAIDSSNYTRSYAYTGYMLPALTRSNLQVLSGYTVTQILFNGTSATGVSFAQYSGASSYSIYANKEVLLCGGVVSTPQLLMVSGVGPNGTLQSNGIDVVSSLPGVGQNVREHLSGSMSFDVTGQVQYSGSMLVNDANFAAQQLSEWESGDASASLYSCSNHMIGMMNLSVIMGGEDAASQFISSAQASIAGYAAGLGDPTVQAGYLAQANADLNTLMPGGIGVIEILEQNVQGYSDPDGSLTMGLQITLQRPLSRGTITITSGSVFDNPTINPAYLSNNADLQLLVSAFEFVRTLSQTAPLTNLINDELTPGPSVNTYDQWTNYLQGVLSTEYSPLGSCAMLPLSLGGVVDAQLNVYGTQNLRVVDASIIPVNIAAHGCAPTYALAETAAEIILGNLAPAPIASSSSKPAAVSASAAARNSGAASASASALRKRKALPLQPHHH